MIRKTGFKKTTSLHHSMPEKYPGKKCKKNFLYFITNTENMENYPPGFSQFNDYGTGVFDKNEEIEEVEEETEEKPKYLKKLRDFIPIDSVQCDRLKNMAHAEYISMRAKKKDYSFRKTYITKFLDPFMLCEFLDMNENQRRIILDSYFEKKT